MLKKKSESKIQKLLGYPALFLSLFFFALFAIRFGFIFLVSPVDYGLKVLLPISSKTYDDGYREGLGFAKTRMAQLGCLSALNKPVTNFFAILKSINSNVLTIELPAKKLDPLGQGQIQKEILVNDQTLIQRVKIKEPDQLNREFADYQRLLDQFDEGLLTSAPTQPTPYIITDAALADLKTLKSGEQLKFETQSDLHSSDPVPAKVIQFLIKQQTKPVRQNQHVQPVITPPASNLP